MPDRSHRGKTWAAAIQKDSPGAAKQSNWLPAPILRVK